MESKETTIKPKPLSNNLLEVLKKIPNQSGVYHYFDSEGRLLYVGKAKNLKNRVKKLFSFHSYSISRTQFECAHCTNGATNRDDTLSHRRK